MNHRPHFLSTLTSTLIKRGYKIVLFFIVLVVLAMSMNLNGDDKLVQVEVYNKTTGWTLVHHEEEKAITLPHNEDVLTNQVVTIETVLDDIPSDGNHMLLRSSMQDMIVKIDGEVIHTHQKAKDGSLNDIDVSMWVLVDLPDDVRNKTMSIEISSSIDAFSGVINEIKFGHESELLLGILSNSFSSIVAFLVLALVGVMIVGLSFVVQKKDDNRILNLGLTFITVGIWLVSEGRVIQFVTGNRWLLSVASYVMIPLMAMFTGFYIRDAVMITKRDKNIVHAISLMFIVVLMIMVVAQVFYAIPFIVSMRWVLLIIFFVVIVVSGLMIQEVIQYGNKQAVRYFKYVGILFVSVIIETIIFYLEWYELTSTFFQVGFVVFLMLLAHDTFRYFKEGYVLEKENEVLGRLVYIDQLTKGKNRAAYERDLQLRLDNPLDTFRLVLLDLNDLKFINDNFGHAKGDVALVAMFSAIEGAFAGVGECYRLGGDEMAVIMNVVDSQVFHACIDTLGKLLDAYNYGFPLKVAVGSDVYSNQYETDFLEFYQQVDQKMYVDKKKLKASTT